MQERQGDGHELNSLLARQRVEKAKPLHSCRSKSQPSCIQSVSFSSSQRPGPPVQSCKCAHAWQAASWQAAWQGLPQLDVPEPGDSYTAASTLLRCTSLRASSSLRELPEMEVSRGAQTESGQQRHSLSRNFLVPELALARGALVVLSGEVFIAAATVWDRSLVAFGF